ncbi:Ornithine cyclodeaminase [Alloactinosynnema sp. L-07]|uniref:2,3-diaminopropionate biosynthesis protein SbnB n=1 Tax=Alloactinosynnema sp. L-07 TaxID=1653480 RepID=UPI00065F0823|nr:2,3-diaminopropionate biosynthesis protein SbnB [Alloactinosynnema sp. L-07]CRK57303.1 Ornithine cyclodeaminase [Alloactinosynnema sp. L-07]
MLIVGNDAVRQVLDGRELEVLAAVRRAYQQHARGATALPHSVFLRFPQDTRNRIIGLPAFLGGDNAVAGMKWIASFPGNVADGLERASAAIILNSMDNGHPVALIEGSTISARRTAASAAVAAATLRPATPDTGVSLIGCGVINFEVLRFLRVVYPTITEVTLHDLDRDRAAEFARRCDPDLAVTIADGLPAALAAHGLVSVATTAAVPYTDLAECRPGTLVLHVSLRDVTIDGVLSSVNVVDDPDHVCRAATSPHLAEQHLGHRDFIHAALGDLLLTDTEHPRDPVKTTLFSPFGLGVLDLAVADLVMTHARAAGLGVELPDFLPSAIPAAAR